MSKKFSTLMASLLLASAFSVNATEETWIKVSQDQFVDGATYKILIQGQDSILYKDLSNTDGGFAAYKRPGIVDRAGSTGKDTLWTVVSTENGFKLKTSASGVAAGIHNVSLYADGRVAEKELVLSDGVLSVDGKTLVNWNNNGLRYEAEDTEIGTKFDFYMLSTATAVTPEEGSEIVKSIPATGGFYVVNKDGKYVGVKNTTLRAAAPEVIEEEAVNITDWRPYVWSQASGALKSVYSVEAVYLTLTGDNAFGVSTSGTNVAYSNTILTAGGHAAQATLATSTLANPMVLADNVDELADVLVNGGLYVLNGNGFVKTGSNSSALSYNPSSAYNHWKLVVVNRGTNNKVAYFQCLTEDKYYEIDGKVVYAKVNSYDTTTGEVTLESANGQFKLYTADEEYVNSNWNTTTNINETQFFGLADIKPALTRAEDLTYFENGGFSLTIKGRNNAGTKWDVTLKNNPFAGRLIPKEYSNGKFVDVDDSDVTFFLQNGNGKYIAVVKELAEGLGTAYALTEITADELKRDIAKETNAQKYFAKFAFSHYRTVADMRNLQELSTIWVYGYMKDNEDDVFKGAVGRLDIDKVAYMAVEPMNVAAEDAISLKPVNVKLGGDNVADWTEVLVPNFVTVKVVTKGGDNNGYVVANALDEDPYSYDDITTTSTVSNVLEAQWAMTYDQDNETYTFKNRENPNITFDIDAYVYETSAARTYSISGETVEIKAVETSPADGYRRLGDVRNQKFNIGYWSNVYTTNAWLTEKHAGTENHLMGMSIDKENALVWSAKEYNNKATYKEVGASYTDTYTKSDSIYVISKIGYWNPAKSGSNKYDIKEDTLKVVAYSFINQYGEPLILDDDYIFAASTADADKNKHAAAKKFVLREANDHLNLRTVKFEEKEAADGMWQYQTFELDAYNAARYMMYAGDTKNGRLTVAELFDKDENDLFDVVATDVPMYRKVAKDLDVIAIHRDSNDKETLYESNGFLGLDNTVQFDKIAPAMIADTGMVSNTYRPTYLLAVGATVTPAGKYCPVHGADADCKDEHLLDVSGWVTGRYLVNLKDTAIAWNAANKHKDGNPYTNTEKLYRLGFVKATHINDTLAIAAAKPAAKDSIYVGDGALTAATFAFRYVDQAAGSFVIETADFHQIGTMDGAINISGARKNSDGYIKWMNGVVVVVPEMKDADIFNMTENYEGEPTANDAISAEAGVQVISGKGVITVQGAAGKVITVADILGRTIANQVAASDNVTIAAPAGIAVVTVDGEATKVVVK